MNNYSKWPKKHIAKNIMFPKAVKWRNSEQWTQVFNSMIFLTVWWFLTSKLDYDPAKQYLYFSLLFGIKTQVAIAIGKKLEYRKEFLFVHLIL